MPRLSGSRTVWRIALLWQGTVLDVVTVDHKSRTVALRTGERLALRVRGETLVVEGLGDIAPGEVVELGAGHALVATRVAPEARAGGLSVLDSTLFHAAMIGAAVQACVVSALVLTPAPALDTEPGAGTPGEWRRFLVSPGGTAPDAGAPSLSAVGRRPDEVERAEPARSPGHPPPSPVGRAMTVQQELAEMSRILQLGNDGTALKEAIGDVARSVARAPVAGADFGGLAPKDPLEAGPGNGLLGVGASQVSEMLHRRIDETEKKARRMVLPPPSQRPAIPVQLIEMPEDTFSRLEAAGSLDPVVKDALTTAVRRRDNAVRACYESRGLAADANRSGRLTLELTLLPDGSVMDPVVHVDDPALAAVGDCVRGIAATWYLGDGLVDEPKRLSFPFILMPKQDGL